MGVVGRLDQYASMLAWEFDDYSMSENLLTNSNISSSNWTINNSAVLTNNSSTSPDGIVNASQIAAPATAGSGVFRTFSLTSATVYTYSVFVKAVSGSNTIYFGTDTTTTALVTVNTSTGVASLNSGSPTNITSVSYPNSWYRVSFTFTASATATHSFVIYNLTASANTWLAYGAQVEAGSIATDYTPTTTAAISRVLPATTNTNITGLGTYYSSGFDENTSITTLVQTGENLLTYSEQFDNAAWGKTNITVQENIITAPDGNTTADKLVENTTNGLHVISQSIGTISGTYTVSCFVKAVERYKGYIQLISSGGNAAAFFDLNLGTITGGAGTNTITAYPNGWYRITSSLTFTSATATCYFVLLNNAGTSSYAGDGTSGIYLWGAQVERGSIATDYIPTTTTTGSRSLPSPIFALSANVFAPYDLVYDEFSGTSFGAGQGRYMRQNTDKSVIVYNEIDEVTDLFGRGIVRDGLLLDLDAGNTASYSGSGTTWTDLSASGNNGTLVNGPTYNGANSGSIVFDGNNDYVSFNTSSFPSGATSFSVNCFIKWSGNGTFTNDIIFSYGRDGSNNDVTVWVNNSGFAELQFGSDTGKVSSTTLLSIGTWYNICATYDKTQTKIYLNSVLEGTTNYSNGNIILDNNVNGNTGAIGAKISGFGNVASPQRYGTFNGNIANTQLYNRALTAAEIQQNYNALKGRFSI